MLEAVDKLKFFLATAPGSFDTSPYDPNDPVAREERCLNRFQLPTGELISCVLWNGLFHVSGTDIVRALHFRFAAFGRPVRNAKKFEEGIFSDLRNLKSGTDATLEEPKSDFLELLFKYNCIRTQKKQKVFYWFSVPHDRLFLDALDRDLKREKLGVEPTTEAVAEPALSFVYNPNKSLFEQFTEQKALEDADATAPADQEKRVEEDGQNPPPVVITEAAGESAGEGLYRAKRRPSQISTSAANNSTNDNGTAVQEADGSQVLLVPPSKNMAYRSASGFSSIASTEDYHSSSPSSPANTTSSSAKLVQTFADPHANSIFGAFSLFEGSPTYKQRRKPGQKRPAKRLESSPGVASHSASPMPGSEFDDHYHSRPSSSSGLFASPLANQTIPGHPYSHPRDRHLRLSPMSPHPPLSAVSSSGEFSVLNPLDSCMLESNATSHQEPGAYGAARAYVCPLFSCGRLFKRLEHLKRHLRIHTSEKPYPCTRCGKRFARSDNLAAHLKIHEKLAARAGSTSSSDQRALEADEELDERMTSLLESMENVDDSEHPDPLSPQNDHLHTPNLIAAPNHNQPGYFHFQQQGLPTPPNVYPDQASCWPQYHGYPLAGSVLTPDQSPDPPGIYGIHSHVARPHSMESSYNFGGDSRRLRSTTPADIRGLDSFGRHSSAGPRIITDGQASYRPAHGGGEPMGLASDSPTLHQFQAQLNMVNTLHAEIKQEGLMQPSYVHAPGGDARRPEFVSHETVTSRENLQGPSPALLASSTSAISSPNSYPTAIPAQSHFAHPSQSMPPPSQPASSYQNCTQHSGQMVNEDPNLQNPPEQLVFDDL